MVCASAACVSRGAKSPQEGIDRGGGTQGEGARSFAEEAGDIPFVPLLSR